MNPRIFPTILMVLDLCAAVVWACYGDWRRAIYWGAAAVLTALLDRVQQVLKEVRG
jgi:hypothetical protein